MFSSVNSSVYDHLLLCRFVVRWISSSLLLPIHPVIWSGTIHTLTSTKPRVKWLTAIQYIEDKVLNNIQNANAACLYSALPQIVCSHIYFGHFTTYYVLSRETVLMLLIKSIAVCPDSPENVLYTFCMLWTFIESVIPSILVLHQRCLFLCRASRGYLPFSRMLMVTHYVVLPCLCSVGYLYLRQFRQAHTSGG